MPTVRDVHIPSASDDKKRKKHNMYISLDGLELSIDEIIRAIKQSGSSREKLRESQRARSKKYGIGAIERGSLTIPAKFARLGAKEGDFADPVNYSYPVWLTKPNREALSRSQLGQVQSAQAYFERFKDRYDSGSQAKVQARINQARKKFKVGEVTKAIEREYRIVKADKKKQVVLGVVLKASRLEDVRPDLQDDTITLDEVEDAAYGFMLNSQFSDLHHKEKLSKNRVRIVESYLAPVDFKMGDVEIRRGDWLAAVKIFDPDIWDQVEKGQIQGFSIKGMGIRRRTN